MSHSFVYPTIVSLPCGYNATIVPPLAQITRRLADPNSDVHVTVVRYRGGERQFLTEVQYPFRNGVFADSGIAPLHVTDPLDDGGDPTPAYLEIETKSTDGRPIFTSKAVFGLYTIYGKRGKASFFSDNAYKYGSPPIISQMARFRVYVDTYPVIHLDRVRALGESLTLINPYRMPIIAQVRTEDGRALKRRKISPQSALAVDLSEILDESEDRWFGQIQLTANNRLVTFTFKHRFGDQTIISDYEHMDPFREDPTHIPLTQKLRLQLGDWLTRHRVKT